MSARYGWVIYVPGLRVFVCLDNGSKEVTGLQSAWETEEAADEYTKECDVVRSVLLDEHGKPIIAIP